MVSLMLDLIMPPPPIRPCVLPSVPTFVCKFGLCMITKITCYNILGKIEQTILTTEVLRYADSFISPYRLIREEEHILFGLCVRLSVNIMSNYLA